MMSDDELRSALADLAGRTEIESVPLHDVQTRGRRRALARRGGLVLAGFALVVGGTVAVTSIGGDDSLDVATEQATRRTPPQAMKPTTAMMSSRQPSPRSPKVPRTPTGSRRSGLRPKHRASPSIRAMTADLTRSPNGATAS